MPEVVFGATYQNTTFGPPPIDFGTIAYWSRGFWYNRSRLLIGRELALDLGFSSKTASDLQSKLVYHEITSKRHFVTELGDQLKILTDIVT